MHMNISVGVEKIKKISSPHRQIRKRVVKGGKNDICPLTLVNFVQIRATLRLLLAAKEYPKNLATPVAAGHTSRRFGQ